MTWNAWFEIQLALGAIFLPLALEAAVRLGRRPGWRQAVILGVVLGAVLLTDLESSIMTGIVVVAALLPWLARRAARGGERAWVKLRLAGIAAAVTAVVASPQLIAMAQQAMAATRPCRRAPWRRTTALRRGPAADIRPLTAAGAFGLKSLAAYYYRSGPHSATFVAYGVVLTVRPCSAWSSAGGGAAPGCSPCSGWAPPGWPWAPGSSSAITGTCRWPRSGTACTCR